MTFNYDTLMEKALQAVLRRTFEGVGDNLAGQTSLIKLNGSINWWHLLSARDVAPTDASTHSMDFTDDNLVRDFTIDHARGLRESADTWAEDFVVQPSRSGLMMPAIAIPMTAMSDFECPKPHLDFLQEALRDVDRMLAIGWRGKEVHFRAMLGGPTLKRLELVTQREGSAEVLGTDLVRSGDVKESAWSDFRSNGFTRYLREGPWGVLTD